jgi:hypothetical protein
MYRKSLAGAVIAAAAILLTTGLSGAAEWELKGSWRLNVTCRDFSQVNNVTIGRADRSKVLGTTNVDNGFGKIVDGAFDGKNFVFTNKYSYDGRSYTEIWRGSLSNNGRSMRGKFETNNTEAGGCSYRGRRV